MERLQSSHSMFAWSAHVKATILKNSVSIRIGGAEVDFIPCYGNADTKHGFGMARYILQALEAALDEYEEEMSARTTCGRRETTDHPECVSGCGCCKQSDEGHDSEARQ